MTEKDLGNLVERATKGDRSAFEELATAHRPRIEGVIRSRWKIQEGDLPFLGNLLDEGDQFLKARSPRFKIGPPFGRQPRRLEDHWRGCTDPDARIRRDRAYRGDRAQRG